MAQENAEGKNYTLEDKARFYGLLPGWRSVTLKRSDGTIAGQLDYHSKNHGETLYIDNIEAHDSSVAGGKLWKYLEELAKKNGYKQLEGYTFNEKLVRDLLSIDENNPRRSRGWFEAENKSWNPASKLLTTRLVKNIPQQKKQYAQRLQQNTEEQPATK